MFLFSLDMNPKAYPKEISGRQVSKRNDLKVGLPYAFGKLKYQVIVKSDNHCIRYLFVYYKTEILSGSNWSMMDKKKKSYFFFKLYNLFWLDEINNRTIKNKLIVKSFSDKPILSAYQIFSQVLIQDYYYCYCKHDDGQSIKKTKNAVTFIKPFNTGLFKNGKYNGYFFKSIN